MLILHGLQNERYNEVAVYMNMYDIYHTYLYTLQNKDSHN